MQPIRVWVTPPGPNPWKIPFLLEELGLPYEVKSIKFDDVKKPPLIDLNPNGRVPSGAIIHYLIEQYDTENTLTYTGLAEKHHLNQWLHFQTSGQGPYYGTSGWFINLHPEKVPSAIERYTQQVRRVLGVLEGWLAGRQWLVGDKMTYADMAWVPYNDRVDMVLAGAAEADKFRGFPRVRAWHERMTARPSWRRSMETRARLMDEQGLTPTGIPKGIASFSEYEAMIEAGEDTTPKQ